MASSVKRILMLHGYAQNASIFYKKMSAIRKAGSKSCEFVFLDAPIILEAGDFPSDPRTLDSTAVPSQADPELTPRAWWRANENRTTYYGIEDTLAYVKDYMAKQETPFHAVMGFSQGACMAALLTVLLERPLEFYPFPFTKTSSNEPVHPPFKTSIFVSGFAVVPEPYSSLFSPNCVGTITKCLHVIGTNDVIVSNARSQSLVAACVPENSRVQKHDGGHFVPSKLSWRNFFAHFLEADDPFSISAPPAPPDAAHEDMARGVL
ncbi:FSH1-domain-containing protein [Sistotremastrum niveocremeum HHB9708]|uniref:FSH1-domain-containing protein n=1 Tax=Sistotremastrum niveocremeum HHB9708 TaxID=1314777 RepID=A0A164NIZ2_9AGAM|nr:FSH1-domain-containing protein [Sistotremastrum niveocremeum HHB9708]